MSPTHSLLLLVSLLLISTSTSSTNSDRVSELQSLQSRSKYEIIHLDNHSVSRYLTSTKSPRPYYLLIFFDATQLHDKSEMFPNTPLSKYDLIIQELSDLGKTFAAEMFYKRACAEKIGLQDATYGCMLRALSKEERVKEAISVYRLVSERGITMNDKSYQACNC